MCRVFGGARKLFRESIRIYFQPVSATRLIFLTFVSQRASTYSQPPGTTKSFKSFLKHIPAHCGLHVADER